MRRYWFKPKQFWKWFAAYYPVTWQGWTITVALTVVFLAVFIAADRSSHSVSDTFYAAVLPEIIVLLIFDIVSFRTGEYPSWWRKRDNL